MAPEAGGGSGAECAGATAGRDAGPPLAGTTAARARTRPASKAASRFREAGGSRPSPGATRPAAYPAVRKFRASPLCPARRCRHRYAALPLPRFPVLAERSRRALVISLDEVVAGGYDEGMQNRISIVSESLAFLP